MNFQSWLTRALVGFSGRFHKNKPIRKRRSPVRLLVEALEDRAVPATLFVDNPADFVITTNNGGLGLDNGDVVTWDPGAGSGLGGPVAGLVLGTNAFTSIAQSLAAAAITGDTIRVAPGNFNERLTITKSVSLRGNQAGIDARTERPGAPESIINGSTLGGAVSIKANNVTIDGFTVQGDASFRETNGIEAGITTGESTIALTGLRIVNNIVHSVPVGISPSGDQALVQHNLVYNTLDGTDNGLIVGNAGLDTDRGLTNSLIDSNRFVNNWDYAIHITSLDPDPPNAANLIPVPHNANNVISNNEMDSELDVSASSNTQIFGNTVTNSFTGGITLGGWDDGITVINNKVFGVSDEFSAFRVKDYFEINGGRPRPNTNVTVMNNTFIGGEFGIGMRLSQTFTGTLTLSVNEISGGLGDIISEDPATPVYSLGKNGDLTRTTPAGTELLDTGLVSADSLAVTAIGLYELEDGGQLWRQSNGLWSLVAVGVAAFRAEAAGTRVYILEGNGDLRLYQPGQQGLSVTPLAVNVKDIDMTNSGIFYFLDTAGSLRQIVNGVISPVDSNVTSFQVDALSNLYLVRADGLWSLTGAGWTHLDTNVTDYHADHAGVVTYLKTGGTLRHAGNVIANNVTSFEVGIDGTVYYLDNALVLREHGVTAALDVDVQSFLLSSDGRIYELKTNNDLVEIDGGVLTRLDRNVKQILVAENGTLYDLELNGSLWVRDVEGWSLLDGPTSVNPGGVNQILLPLGSGVLDLEANGELWQYTSRGWSLWQTRVVGISPGAGRTQVQTQDARGVVRTLGIVDKWAPTGGPNGFTQLLNNGELWQYAGNAWTRLDLGVRDAAFTANGTIVDLQNSGNLWVFVGGSWSFLGTKFSSFSLEGDHLVAYEDLLAKQFFLTNVGPLHTGIYEWDTDGALFNIDGNNRTPLDVGVSQFAVAGANLYDLEDNGQLWRLSQAGWTLVDMGVSQFGTDNGGNLVYILEGNGNLRQYQAANNTLSVVPLATSIKQLGVTGTGTAFFLNTAGNLQRHVGGILSSVDTSVASFQLDGAGNLYELLTNGNLHMTNSATAPLATNVTSFDVTNAGVVTTLQTGGTLRQGTTTLATNATAFNVDRDGTVFFTNTALNLIQQGVGTVEMDVQNFAVASDDFVYARTTGGSLIRRSDTSAVTLDVGVQEFQVGPSGALYDLEANGSLWLLAGAGWQKLDGIVADIQFVHGAGILDLENNHELWLYTFHGWTRWDVGVTALANGPAPFQALVTDGNGQRTLSIIQATAVNNAGNAFFDVLRQNVIVNNQLVSGVLVKFQGGVWSTIAQGVVTVAVSANDTLIELETNGMLWIFTTQWTLLDTGVTGFTVNGNTIMATTTDGPKVFTV